MNLLDLARSALPSVTVTSRASAAEEHRQGIPEPLAEVKTPRAVIAYDLIDGKGGVLIDPRGAVSGVHELHWRFGDRLDWPALLATFNARERDADLEAMTLIRRIAADAYRARWGE